MANRTVKLVVDDGDGTVTTMTLDKYEIHINNELVETPADSAGFRRYKHDDEEMMTVQLSASVGKLEIGE